MVIAPKTDMAERAILTGLVALVLLTALVKMGPSLTASFDQVGAIHQTVNPAISIDHRMDEERARAVLSVHESLQEVEAKRSKPAKHDPKGS